MAFGVFSGREAESLFPRVKLSFCAGLSLLHVLEGTPQSSLQQPLAMARKETDSSCAHKNSLS